MLFRSGLESRFYCGCVLMHNASSDGSMRAIVISVIFISLTSVGAVLLISAGPYGPTWALALILPLIWLAHTGAAAITPIASTTGAITAELSPERLALNAYAMLQFALLGAIWLALPSYWLQRGGGMPAALSCAGAATAWLVLYRRRWAYPLWLYFQPAQARRLTILALAKNGIPAHAPK